MSAWVERSLVLGWRECGCLGGGESGYFVGGEVGTLCDGVEWMKGGWQVALPLNQVSVILPG